MALAGTPLIARAARPTRAYLLPLQATTSHVSIKPQVMPSFFQAEHVCR